MFFLEVIVVFLVRLLFLIIEFFIIVGKFLVIVLGIFFLFNFNCDVGILLWLKLRFVIVLLGVLIFKDLSLFLEIFKVLSEV